MRKRLSTLCVLLVLVFSLTACVRLDATVKINTNGTADVSMLLAVSDTLAAMGDDSPAILSEETIDEYRAKGFECEEYTDVDGGYSGYILSQKGLDLQSGEKQGNETGIESILNGELFSVDGTHVTIDYVPFSDSEYEESGAYLSLLKNYGGYMKFNLKLPVKPTNHNATVVSKDGKTLTWDLTKLQANEGVHAEFDLPSSSIFSGMLPLAGVILVAVIVAIAFVEKKKNSVATDASVEKAPEIGVMVDESANELQTDEESSQRDDEESTQKDDV